MIRKHYPHLIFLRRKKNISIKQEDFYETSVFIKAQSSGPWSLKPSAWEASSRALRHYFRRTCSLVGCMLGSWNPEVIGCVWIPDHTFTSREMLPVCVYTHTKRETTFKWGLVDKKDDTGYPGEVLHVEHRSETVHILVLSICNACICLERHWTTECL